MLWTRLAGGRRPRLPTPPPLPSPPLLPPALPLRGPQVSGKFSAFNRDSSAAVAVDVRFEDPSGTKLYEKTGVADDEFRFQASIR